MKMKKSGQAVVAGIDAVSSSARRSLTRRPLGLMALEQRFMFDGAAVSDATQVDAKTVDASLLSVRATDTPSAAFLAAQQQAQKLITEALANPQAAAQWFELFSGQQTSASAQWQAAFNELVSRVQGGQYQVTVELRTNEELQGARGAFAARGENGLPVIYINADWVRSVNDSTAIARVLVEEIGHSFDVYLNPSADTQGDEGDALAVALMGNAVGDGQRLASDDHATLNIDGVAVEVEKAAPAGYYASFNAIYTANHPNGNNFDTFVQVNITDGQGVRVYSTNPTAAGYDPTITFVNNGSSNTVYLYINGSVSQMYLTNGAQGIAGGPEDVWVLANNTLIGSATQMYVLTSGGYSINTGGETINSSITLSNLDNLVTVQAASAPTIAVSTSTTSLASGGTATITFTLSASSTDFTASDVTVTGGTLSNFSGSGTSYTATFTPNASSTTNGVVKVASGVFSDSTGLSNADGAQANNTVTMTVDTVLPTIAISSSKSSLAVGETATLTFTLSESSTNFTSSDVTVSGGTLSNFSGSGTSYTATFTPTANSTTNGVVSVASTTFSDAAGNNNADGSDTNNTVTMTVDTIRPTIVVSSDKTSLVAGDTATLTFTLSESSTNFTASDVTVSGGTLSNFSGSGTTYTATFTPTANSTANAVVNVASGTFSDAAGNTNNDGSDTNNTVTMVVDTIRPTIVVSSNKTSLAAGETATLTFTLSESSTNFTASDVTVSGGTLSNFSGSGTTYTATFTPTANSTTNAVVNVASGTFSDAAGNNNADGSDTDNTVTMTVDTVRPTIVVSSNKTSLVAGDTATLTFTLSESSTNFTASDITVSGGTLSNFSGSGTTYTATFTPTANSTANAVINVASGVFSDAAGNTNNDGSDADNAVTMTVDTIRPTIAVSSNKTSLAAGETATLTFTLSESSTNFTASDVTVSGGTLSNFSGSGTSYTATFTPTANSTANAVVNVASSTFSDAAGNNNADGSDADNTVTMTVDTVRPTIVVSSNKTNLVAGDTATLTFTLSESSTNFTASDITVSGGTLSNFSGSGTSYTATFTPTANSTTNAVVNVASGTFSDAAGNNNNDGSDADNTVTMAVDTIRPTVAVSSNKTSLLAGDTATLTFTLSESSTNFTAGDITVSGGTLSNFSGSGTTYTATFTPAPNSTANAVINVASGVFSDAAGNNNTDGSDADNTVTMAVDTVRPTIVVSSNKTSLVVGDTATLTFTLSESSTNFTASDITVSGGTLSNFSGSGTSYTATFTPTANSTANAVINVASGTFSDAAGNNNTDGSDADNTVTMTVDTVRPTVVVSSNKTSLVAGDTATLTFTLSESSTNFTASDITVSGGTLSNFSGSGTTYTATFTPTANSTANAVVNVASGVFSDAAGNNNTDGSDADNTVTMSVDTVRPTVAVTSNRTSLVPGQTATLTFTLSESSTNFTAGDITVSGGTLSNFSGSGTTYTATFTPTANSTANAVINVASGTFSDAAGNNNTDGSDTDNTVTMAVDTVVSISVNSVVVNEASPYAYFRVTLSRSAGVDIQFTPTLTSATATVGTDLGQTLQYFDGTRWLSASQGVTLAAGATQVMLRTAITPDANYEGAETFTLSTGAVASFVSNTSGASGTGEIRDDGQGDIFNSDGSVDTTTLADDDRPVTVSSPTVNEASPYAVFTVSGSAGQKVSLSLAAGTAGPNDFVSAMEVSADGGRTWVSYTAGSFVALGSQGSLLVRVQVLPDVLLEHGEDFTLSASNTAGSARVGTATIVDEGNGTLFRADGSEDTTSTKDDDRPKPVAVVKPVVVEPTVEVQTAAPVEISRPAVAAFNSAIPVQPADRTQVVVRETAPVQGDILTSNSGFRVVVNENAPAGLTVNRLMSDQFVDGSAPAKVTMPADAFIHSKQDAVISLESRMVDNTPLPSWVSFDTKTGIFQVDAPASFKGKLTVKVNARDDNGREATMIFSIFVGEQPSDAKPADKPLGPQSRNSLSEKLRLANQRPSGAWGLKPVAANDQPVKVAANARVSAVQVQ